MLVESKRSSYKHVAVDFEVRGKKATMIIKDGWNEPELLEWRFITGDHLIDSTAKIMTDFSAFSVLDYEMELEGGGVCCWECNHIAKKLGMK